MKITAKPPKQRSLRVSPLSDGTVQPICRIEGGGGGGCGRCIRSDEVIGGLHEVAEAYQASSRLLHPLLRVVKRGVVAVAEAEEAKQVRGVK